jgi:hypothetical protein
MKHNLATLTAITLLGLVVLLAGCRQPAVADPGTANRQPIESSTQPSPATPALRTDAPSPGAWPDGRSQTSDQGAVTIVVTPLNLNNPDESLEFEVVMDTHSLELDMDLAPLSTLTADNGLNVGAISWDAPGGGHHVAGKLSFPTTVDGKDLLEGAAVLTISIRDVDVAERLLSWNVSD